jgi:hypothetical protein
VHGIRWNYTGHASPERLRALVQSRPNTELPEALKRGLTLKCFHREARGDDASYKRAVFCGTVARELFDWFFNARTGYRGAFFDSPEAGLKANRLLIDSLAGQLAEWAVNSGVDADSDWILGSLAKPSAKAWLAEYPGLCPTCEWEWNSSSSSELRIANGRWEHSAHIHAAWGQHAPYLTKIRFFGGFMDVNQREWIADHKTGREAHIWEHGWS